MGGRPPQALVSVVRSVALNDLGIEPSGHKRLSYTLPTGAHALAPDDFATIYNLGPVYAGGVAGTGINIAVAGVSDINISDVQLFRAVHGLAPKDPVILHPADAPGDVGGNDEGEALLDVEWAGAVARDATVILVATPRSEGGPLFSAQYAVDQNFASIVSVSFGLCESALGPAANATIDAWSAQAAAQGISVVVSSGDSGAAGCDMPASSLSVSGRAVNGLCSTPNTTCVGGTEFLDSSAYWSSGNNPTTLASALSYIPEAAWNESGPNGPPGNLWATGGGQSSVYSKPSWQAAPGVTNDGTRDVPDISLASAEIVSYRIKRGGATEYWYGTSAAAPSFAGLVALLRQHVGGRLGNLNPRLYQLGNAQYSVHSISVFHDVVTGDNSVPGQLGFATTPGYDVVTGLGTVDATGLLNAWGPLTATYPVASFTVSPTSPVAAQTVHFSDTSAGGPTSWAWSFGDGSTSAAQNPSHIFAAPGNYTVSMHVYNNFGNSPSSAQVTVGPAAGAGCTPTPTTLCLNGGRFRVSASWQSTTASGSGTAVALTGDTGYFWFFSSNNVEMVVKVLNGCPLNSRYWVFSGGLTNVNVTVQVTDTRTGSVRFYTNPINTAFQPIQDTSAFATCP